MMQSRYQQYIHFVFIFQSLDEMPQHIEILVSAVKNLFSKCQEIQVFIHIRYIMLYFVFLRSNNYERKVKMVMVNNSNNIKQMNSYLLPQIIDLI